MHLLKNRIPFLAFVFTILGSLLIVKAFASSPAYLGANGVIHVDFYDTTSPVIIENAELSKEMFVLQAKEIDFGRYVTASDNLEGDITHKIAFSIPEDFYTTPGNHTITYTVKDRAGNTTTHDITFNIWNIVKIEGGERHAVALTSHGKVYTWGGNLNGQIGDGTYGAANNGRVPKIVAGLDNIIDIAASLGSSYALRSDGQLFSWGYNAYGKLGDGTATDRHVPTPINMSNGVKFKKISSNYYNAAAVATDGSVYSWGESIYGSSGSGDGVVRYNPTKINISNIADISMGYHNGAAITTDGKLYTWGNNLYGGLGNGRALAATTSAPAMISIPNYPDIIIKQVNVGEYHSIAVSTDGKVFTWGNNGSGRLGNGNTSNTSVPQEIQFTSPAEEVMASNDHTMVRLQDSRVYLFGYNGAGKLGISGGTVYSTPQLLNTSTLGSSTNLALMRYTSSIIIDHSIVYSFGEGTYYSFGNNLSNNSHIPTSWIFTPPPIV